MSRKITNRSQLIYALTEAAELEHVLMCQYMYAAASLKTSIKELPNENRKYHQIELIRSWKKQLLLVAREEMQHLTYVINLLVSIGGTPTFARPNFPNSNQFYKDPNTPNDLTMSLERFDEITLKRFIKFEAPPPDNDHLLKFFIATPKPNYYATLHEFYESIKAAFDLEGIFLDVTDQYDVMDEIRSAQVAYRPPVNNTVKNAIEAKRLIDIITEQGEGSSGADDLAHAHIFENMLTEYEEELRQDINFEPSRPVLKNPLTRKHEDLSPALIGQVNIICEELDGGLPYNLLQLFNGAYEILLTWLFQVFNRHGSKEELLAIESIAFMPYMSEVIRPIMEFLTRIPVKQGGKEFRLGAGFEVTSNNFLIPKPEIAHILTIERLTEMQDLSCTILSQLAVSNYNDLATLMEDFKFIQKTIIILKEEFICRVKDGIPPKSPDLSKSEMTSLLKPDVITPFLITKMEWNLRGPAILALNFQGWFQTWLASDPDGANDKRGVTGNNFALDDEPDFNRVIYLNSNLLRRSHCPEIGIKVIKARIITPPTGLNNELSGGQEFLNATIDLLDNPKFEGRNHLVAGNGEPIDPFNLSITTADKRIKLTRAVIGSGEINDMTSAQRAGTGRNFSKAAISTELLKEYLSRIPGNYTSPNEYLEKRISAVQTELDHEIKSNPAGTKIPSLTFRLKCLEETRKSANGERVAGFLRWTRFFFAFNYNHSISGTATVDMGGVDLGYTIKTGKPGNVQSKWLVDYNMGFYDSDALSGFMYGSVKIPISFG